MRTMLMMLGGMLLPISAFAMEIINLDVKAHVVELDADTNYAEQITLAPNETWRGVRRQVAVRVVDGRAPDAISHVQDTEVWAIWKDGVFGIQSRRNLRGQH